METTMMMKKAMSKQKTTAQNFEPFGTRLEFLNHIFHIFLRILLVLVRVRVCVCVGVKSNAKCEECGSKSMKKERPAETPNRIIFKQYQYLI